MLYLNEGFGGGATSFFSDAQQAYHPPDPAAVIQSYTPRQGEALLFHSSLMHDGGALEHGCKWIMRSEVMFELLVDE
jgi:hypothetical protein